MPSYWSGAGNPDDKTVLDPEDDAAYIAFGGRWRMPTKEEWQELIANCDVEWTTLNNVVGIKFTSRKPVILNNGFFCLRQAIATMQNLAMSA